MASKWQSLTNSAALREGVQRKASWTATATRSRPKGRRGKSRARSSRCPRTRTYGRRAGTSGASPRYRFAIPTDPRLTVGLRVGSDRTATRAPRRAGALSFEHGAALASEGGGSENGVDDHPWMDL